MPPPGLDTTHAKDATCVDCHKTLDPSRSILSSTFSFYYGQQTDTPTKDGVWSNQNGKFLFQGVEQDVASLNDFAGALAGHKLFGPAWVQKLCYYVNSEACVTKDPEFTRLAGLFQQKYAWNDLVKALVTSPLTTHAASTLTATTNGEVTAVSRRDHLCASLNARLGFADICGLDSSRGNVLPATATAIVPGLPSDGYGRGTTAPVLPNDPSLFFRAGLENFCTALSLVVIDNAKPPAGATSWQSSKCTSGASCRPIDDFVAIVAGIPPSDARSAPLRQAFGKSFDAAKSQSGITATQALQSTFIAACLSPSATAIGL
jgi:hypothetical protein